jgi:crotonobetainyl-CoA:carnitine CoA-transferase CaiB-like acyl-CoA transferase
VTKTKTTGEWIDIFNKATIPVSKVNSIEEVTQDPFVRDILIRSKDPVTGTTLTLSPPPVTTEYLKSVSFELGFPPRFGAENEEIYGKTLGYGAEELKDFKERQII